MYLLFYMNIMNHSHYIVRGVPTRGFLLAFDINTQVLLLTHIANYHLSILFSLFQAKECIFTVR